MLNLHTEYGYLSMVYQHSRSRRRFLGAAATAGIATLSTVPTVAGATVWRQAASPTDRTLHDVGFALDGAYAVGESGLLLERDAGNWRVIADGGPDGNGDDQFGLDATDDGESVWFVGASGTIGEYDVTTGLLGDPSGPDDHSTPDDYTGNFRDVAVTGDRGEANVYVADDSGYVHYSFDDGENWEYVSPGSGSEIPAIDFFEDTSGHLADTNQAVFETDTVETWNRIGIEDVDENFYGISSNNDDDVWVCGSRGTVFHYDGQWRETSLGGLTLRSIDVAAERNRGLTAGSGGRVFRKTGAWTEETTPTERRLRYIVRGDPGGLTFQPTVSDLPDVAVGEDGTIIENDS